MKGSGGNEAAPERPNRVLSSHHVTETKQGWVLPRTRLPHGLVIMAALKIIEET